MSNVIAARTAMRQLAVEAEQLVQSKSLSTSEKRSRMAEIEAEIKAHGATVESANRNAWLAGGAEFRPGGQPLPEFYGTKSLHAAPPILPSVEQMRELYESAVSRKSFRVEVKTPMDVSGQMPPILMPGVVAKQHEPTRVADHIPTTSMAGPSVEYLRHLSTTGTATTVAAGAAKPEVTLVTDTIIATARKIAAQCGVTDESLADFSTFVGYLQAELTRILVDQENAQLLSGDGTGVNLTGLLTTTGILTRAVATDTGLDAIEQAINDLRIGSAFAVADTIVLNPSDWSKLRRFKDTQGRYLVAPDPTSTEASSLWGLPVVTTTTLTAGTGVVAALQAAAVLHVRQGITIDSTPFSGTDFVSNVTRFRVEERIALAVARPSAIVKVTGL